MISIIFLKNFLKEITLLDSQKTLQKLATEMFSMNNGLPLKLISEIFHHYGFRHQSETKFK